MHKLRGRPLLPPLLDPFRVDRLADVLMPENRDDQGQEHFLSSRRMFRIVTENGVSTMPVGVLAPDAVVNVPTDAPTARAVRLPEVKYLNPFDRPHAA